MSKEIERKFLVVNESYKSCSREVHTIAQGYLSADPKATVRVRVFDNKGFLTVKSKNVGATRDEWEYEIPLQEAEEMLNLCDPSAIIRKTRYRVGAWEIDEFGGRLEGLVVAEIELNFEEQEFEKPSFIGDEVTGDPRYYNSNLSRAKL